MQKKLFGNAIETLVCTFLEEHDLRCVERNFTCRLGEIDLVMFEASSNTLVFVEVRFRANAARGNATESVDWKKRQKLRRTVLHYLQKNATAFTNARIDVVGVCHSSSPDQQQHLQTPCVTEHVYQGYLLIWTRNAIEEH